MKRRALPLLLVGLGLLLCGWLLGVELEDAGLFGGQKDDAAARAAERRLLEERLEADLERRLRLRGLPGVETARRGDGRLVGTVKRHVRDLGPQPFPGVRVQVIGLEQDRDVRRDAETDAAGAFAFDALPANPGYAILIHEPPFREVILKGLNVSSGRTTDVGDILLGAPTALQGVVEDALGRPLPGATVQVFRDESRPERLDLRRGLQDLQGASEPFAETASATGGAFKVTDLPPGRYVLRVSAPGYAAAFRDGLWVTADERAPLVRVVLDLGAGYHGRVLDGEGGAGVSGARVIGVAVQGPSMTRLDRVETRSGPDGAYRLDGLVAGVRYFVEAWAEGFAPTGRVLEPAGVAPLDLVLSKSGRVEGTIRDSATGQGVPGAEVSLLAGMANTLSPVSTVTTSDGRYVLENVSAGPIFFFAVKADGYPAGSFDAGSGGGKKVVAGETTVVDFDLEGGAAVVGRVSDRRGRPVPYASVAVFDPKRRFDGEETALTDLEGRYRVGGLRPGRLYEIRVAAAGYAPVLDESAAHVQVTPGVREVVKDFVLEGGAALTGTVRDPDGAPVSGARIALIAEGGRREQSSVADLAAVTNAVGAWRLEGVPPGLGLQVEARHDLWARAVSERLVLEPDQEHAVDLVLGVGLKLEGRVTDERGRPVAEARVRWGVVPPGEENRLGDEFRADQLLVQRVVRTTEEGAFVVDRLEPARYLLKVEKEGYADWYRKDLVIGGDGAVPFQPVELLGASSITGRVRAAASGTPIVDAWVYAEERKPGAEETADPGRVRAVVSAQTGRDGRYALEGLPPGRYNVVVWLAVGYQAAAQNWRDPTSRREDVASGTANVDFELVP